MKTKILTLAIAILGFTTASFAQSNATATSSATLLTPLTIENKANLDFGTLASSNTNGTAILSTDGGVTKTGGVGVIVTSGVTPKAAQFLVTGALNSKYHMVAPSSIELTGPAGNLTLTLNYDKSTTELNDLTSGTSTIKVGGILDIPANTVAGTYTNASGLKITVNYE